MDPRLKSKIQIDNLFTQGKSHFAFPIKLIYLHSGDNAQKGIQFAVSVSKKRFKNATDRNKIKRRMREAVRSQLNSIDKDNVKYVSLLLIYVGQEILDFNRISKSTIRLFDKLKLL